MNLLFEKQVDRDVSIFVYDTSKIDVKEIMKYGIDPELINSKRKLQTELYKYLIAEYYNVPLDMILKSEFNKPYVKGKKGYISISHTKDLIAIIYSKKNSVGIDIELISDRVLKIAHKFTHKEEEKLRSKGDGKTSTLILWCAKEAMYKIFEKRTLSFTENIRLLDFEYNEKTQELYGWINKSGDQINCKGAYMILNKFLLVYFIKDQ